MKWKDIIAQQQDDQFEKSSFCFRVILLGTVFFERSPLGSFLFEMPESLNNMWNGETVQWRIWIVFKDNFNKLGILENNLPEFVDKAQLQFTELLISDRKVFLRTLE